MNHSDALQLFVDIHFYVYARARVLKKGVGGPGFIPHRRELWFAYRKGGIVREAVELDCDAVESFLPRLCCQTEAEPRARLEVQHVWVRGTHTSPEDASRMPGETTTRRFQ